MFYFGRVENSEQEEEGEGEKLLFLSSERVSCKQMKLVNHVLPLINAKRRKAKLRPSDVIASPTS